MLFLFFAFAEIRAVDTKLTLIENTDLRSILGTNAHDKWVIFHQTEKNEIPKNTSNNFCLKFQKLDWKMYLIFGYSLLLMGIVTCFSARFI